MKQLWVFLLFLSPLGAIADVWLPAIFSNDMVLQQQSSVTVWGWAQPGEKVKVTGSWLGESINTVTNENAVWKLTITTPKAGGPHTLSIEGRNKIVLQNVMVGEVWLCAGQSNMEWSAEHGVKDAKAELPTAYNANIRFFKMPKLTAETPQTDTKGKWAICDSSTLKRFSAVGYFFGKKLTQSLNVPIGLIDVAWGGSYIESWIPEHIVNMFPNTRISAETMIPSKGWPRQAGYIYNGMVAPITPFNIAGVLWYQGESNRHFPSTYYQLMHLLVDTWRGAWQKDFPFYYVQIAPFNYRDSTEFKAPAVREMQTRAMDIRNSGMIVVTDLVDNLNDIHPAYKREVGNRLAGWALAETYGQKTGNYRSPQYRSWQVEGNKAWVTFDWAESGLIAKGNTELAEFEIAGSDHVFHKAKAKIVKGNQVEVTSDKVSQPVAVRFAFRDTPVPNLFNKEGLPAIPFRTDDWKLGK